MTSKASVSKDLNDKHIKVHMNVFEFRESMKGSLINFFGIFSRCWKVLSSYHTIKNAPIVATSIPSKSLVPMWYVDKKWASKTQPQPSQALGEKKKAAESSSNHRKSSAPKQHRRRHSLDEMTFSKYIVEIDQPPPLKSRAASLDMKSDMIIPKIKHDTSIHNNNGGGGGSDSDNIMSTVELLHVLRDQDKTKVQQTPVPTTSPTIPSNWATFD
ncbi:hypothetical protein LINGRAHAP2_LOCUS17019 [Linum grandiflorum]